MCRNGCKFYWDVERIQTITKKLKINKKIHQLKEVYNIKKLWGTTIKLFYDQQLLSIISFSYEKWGKNQNSSPIELVFRVLKLSKIMPMHQSLDYFFLHFKCFSVGLRYSTLGWFGLFILKLTRHKMQTKKLHAFFLLCMILVTQSTPVHQAGEVMSTIILLLVSGLC